MRLLTLLLMFVSINCYSACNQPYTKVEESKDRIGVIILCPKCNEDTITRYYNHNKVVKSECNNCQYSSEHYNESKDNENVR